MGRSRCSVKEGMKRGAWTAAEDKILKDYIKANGEGKWRNLPKKAGLKRCGKSCRHRWTNYLRPDIKRGNITDDEVDLIIRLHNLLGNRWSLIAGRLPGRTDNEIKNYWNTNIHKTMNGQLPSSTSNRKPPNPSKENHNHMTKQSVIPSSSTMSCSTLVCTKASGCTRAFTTEESHKAQPLHDIMVAPEKQELVTPIASDGYNSSNFTMDFEMDEKLIFDFLNSENSTLFSFEDGMKCNGNPNTDDMSCWTPCPNQNGLFSGEIFVEDFDIEPMTFNIHKTMNGQLPSSTSNHKPPNPSKDNHNHMTKQSVIPSPSTISCSTLVCTKASGCTRAFTTEESHKAQPLALHDIMVAPEKQELVTPIASDGYNSSNFTMDFEMDEKLISDFLNSENSTLFSFKDGVKCNGNPNTNDMRCWTRCPNQNALFSGEIFVEDFDIEPMTFNILDTKMDWLKKQ